MDRRIIEMGIIWLIILFIAALMLLHQQLSKKKQITICLVIAISLSLLSSIRTIGWDIPNYQELYQNYFIPFWTSFNGLASFFNRSYEPINYILALLFGSGGFRLYLLTTCVFPMLVAWYLSRAFSSPLLYFGSFVLINFSTIDQSRQFLASGFVLLGYIVSGLLPTIIAFCLAALAHYGSAPVLILSFVKKRRPSQCNLLFLGLLVFIVGKVLPLFGVDSILGALAGRMGGYFNGFFSANNLLRTVFYFYLPVSSILFLASTRSSSFDIASDNRIPVYNRLVQADNSYLVASVLFISLLLGTGSDVISTRLFSVCGVGNFLLVGKYLENNSNERAFVPCVLWLISLNVAWSAQYFYGYIT